jgi:hypothetical protein
MDCPHSNLSEEQSGWNSRKSGIGGNPNKVTSDRWGRDIGKKMLMKEPKMEDIECVMDALPPALYFVITAWNFVRPSFARRL